MHIQDPLRGGLHEYLLRRFAPPPVGPKGQADTDHAQVQRISFVFYLNGEYAYLIFRVSDFHYQGYALQPGGPNGPGG